jgi:hypothetical protein
METKLLFTTFFPKLRITSIKTTNNVNFSFISAEVDLNKIDYRSDPKQSKSLLELFILIIIKNLGLNAK